MKSVYILWLDDYGNVHKHFVDVLDIDSISQEELKIVESLTNTKFAFQTNLGAYFFMNKVKDYRQAEEK